MRSLTSLCCAVLAVGAAASAAHAAPIVWVQAGHEGPREPGYRDHTGAGSGPFGAEVTFTTRVASALERRLRAAGVDARHTPGLVTPYGARGAVFISIHHDSPGGSAAVGYAVSNPSRGENYYRGEGSGTASPTPYSDSAPHRPAVPVTPAVERRSRVLAQRVAVRLGRAHTPANGADAPFDGVIARNGNPRMQYYYGYYRTRAAARILVECGAAGADDVFMRRTNQVAAVLAGGVLAHLRATRALTPTPRA